jgi:uncharacterized protein (TIGR00251 family)
VTDSRTRLSLRVSPNARRSAVVGRHGEGWRLRVAAPAESGRANRSLTAFLAELLRVPADDVRIVAGGGGREKIVEIEGRDAAEADAALAAAAVTGEDRG